MALWRDGAFVADDWAFPRDDEAVASGSKAAIGKRRFLAEREALLGRGGALGLALDSDENLAGLEGDLPRFALVVLRFPKFSDGRGYSLARRLRDVHGYAGELRAAGEVLRDQLGFLRRAGFDSLEISDTRTVEALRQGAIVAVGRHYQPASPRRAEPRPPGPGWRRTSPR